MNKFIAAIAAMIASPFTKDVPDNFGTEYVPPHNPRKRKAIPIGRRCYQLADGKVKDSQGRTVAAKVASDGTAYLPLSTGWRKVATA